MPQSFAGFEWQADYADVSQSNREQVKGYIVRQEERHRKMSFSRGVAGAAVQTRSGMG
jgi:hypothetical protein